MRNCHSLHKNIFSNKPDVKVTDIAMIGSHDAFSHKISPSSFPDPHDKRGILSPHALKLLKNRVAKLSKAQVSDAYTQLTKGVRFFDVRVTHTAKGYYTMHGLTSAPLEEYLADVLRFLQDNDGEIVVLAMQYFKYSQNGYDALFRAMAEVRVNGKNIFDYVSYPKKPLEDLTYGDVTANGTQSGVVLLAKYRLQDGVKSPYIEKVYDFQRHTRITWHNDIRTKPILGKIRAEVLAVLRHKADLKHVFRINQAQKTPVSKFGYTLYVAFFLSLLKMSARWNVKLINQPDFADWLHAMPVVFFDYVDTDKNDFNNRINKIINDYNYGL